MVRVGTKVSYYQHTRKGHKTQPCSKGPLLIRPWKRGWQNKNKVVRSLSRKISDLRSQKKKMREGFKFFFSSSGFCPDRCSKTDELKLHHWKHFSPHVTESKAVLDFGFNAVDFGFQELDSGIFVSGTWILACVQTPPIWIQDSNR